MVRYRGARLVRKQIDFDELGVKIYILEYDTKDLPTMLNEIEAKNCQVIMDDKEHLIYVAVLVKKK